MVPDCLGHFLKLHLNLAGRFLKLAGRFLKGSYLVGQLLRSFNLLPRVNLGLCVDKGLLEFGHPINLTTGLISLMTLPFLEMGQGLECGRQLRLHAGHHRGSNQLHLLTYFTRKASEVWLLLLRYFNSHRLDLGVQVGQVSFQMAKFKGSLGSFALCPDRCNTEGFSTGTQGINTGGHLSDRSCDLSLADGLFRSLGLGGLGHHLRGKRW